MDNQQRNVTSAKEKFTKKPVATTKNTKFVFRKQWKIDTPAPESVRAFRVRPL